MLEHASLSAYERPSHLEVSTSLPASPPNCIITNFPTLHVARLVFAVVSGLYKVLVTVGVEDAELTFAVVVGLAETGRAVEDAEMMGFAVVSRDEAGLDDEIDVDGLIVLRDVVLAEVETTGLAVVFAVIDDVER